MSKQADYHNTMKYMESLHHDMHQKLPGNNLMKI